MFENQVSVHDDVLTYFHAYRFVSLVVISALGFPHNNVTENFRCLNDSNLAVHRFDIALNTAAMQADSTIDGLNIATYFSAILKGNRAIDCRYVSVNRDIIIKVDGIIDRINVALRRVFINTNTLVL